MASKKKISVSFTCGNIESTEKMKKLIMSKFENDSVLVETYHKFNGDKSISTTLSFRLKKAAKN